MALYVRKLEEPEVQELHHLIAHDESDLPASRLHIVQLSAEGKRVPEISEEVDLHPINVRKWIHRFNQEGLDGLRSGKSPGRPPLFSDKQRRQISRIAMTNPRVLGQSFSKWSLQRLRKYLIEQAVVKCISVETVRQIVQAQGADSMGRHRWL